MYINNYLNYFIVEHMHSWFEIHWLLDMTWQDIYILPIILCAMMYALYISMRSIQKYRVYKKNILWALEKVEKNMLEMSKHQFYASLHQIFRIYFCYKNIPGHDTGTLKQLFTHTEIPRQKRALFSEIYTKEFDTSDELTLIGRKTIIDDLKHTL